MNQTVYSDLSWYNLRANEQKLVILPICRAQKRFHLVGYGIFDANMEIFLKVKPHFFLKKKSFRNIFFYILDYTVVHFLLHYYAKIEGIKKNIYGRNFF